MRLTAQELADGLKEHFNDLADEPAEVQEFGPVARATTIREGGYLTDDEGVILELTNGQRFYVMVKEL